MVPCVGVLLLAPQSLGLGGVWMGLTLLMTARMLVGFARYDLRRLKDARGESSSGRLPLVAQRGTEGGRAGSQVGFSPFPRHCCIVAGFVIGES